MQAYKEEIPESYLRDVRKTKPLPPEEEKELSKRIKKGDSAARDKLVEANLRFVLKIAGEYQGRGVPLNDLISAGNLGLIIAADRYDPKRGYKFISYAVWWIRQNMLNTLQQENRTVRVPLNVIGDKSKIAKYLLQLIQETENLNPDIEALSDELNLSYSRTERALTSTQSEVSLDDVMSDDNKTTLLEALVDETQPLPDQEIYVKALKREITKALDFLPYREAQILQLYYGLNGEPLSLAQIGQRMRLTRERIRQIKDKALRRLFSTRGEILQPYTEY